MVNDFWRTQLPHWSPLIVSSLAHPHCWYCFADSKTFSFLSWSARQSDMSLHYWLVILYSFIALDWVFEFAADNAPHWFCFPLLFSSSFWWDRWSHQLLSGVIGLVWGWCLLDLEDSAQKVRAFLSCSAAKSEDFPSVIEAIRPVQLSKGAGSSFAPSAIDFLLQAVLFFPHTLRLNAKFILP